MTYTTTSSTWTKRLGDQLSWHWDSHLRPGLATLSDDEYLWEPAADCWSVRPRSEAASPMAAGGGELVADYAWPEPVPAPVTTIAWRLAHLIVGVFGSRNATHFEGPACEYSTWEYAGDAAAALDQLDDAYRRWVAGVRTLDHESLERPIGPGEGEWSSAPYADLVLHISREAIHHGAEILLLRDLYLHRAMVGEAISVEGRGLESKPTT